MKMPLISVVVPIWNVEKWLDDCVKSVLAQTYVNFELILVDDGSPDGCPRKCDEWAAQDNRIKVIHKKNEGRSIARNVGVDCAIGDFVTFLDPDDFLSVDYLEYLMSLLQKHPDCQYAECSMTVWRDGHLLPYKDTPCERTLTADEAIRAVLYDKMRVSCCAKLLPIDLAKSVRFPAGRIHEDAYTICEFLSAINKVIVSNQPLYIYRLRPNSTVTRPYEKWNVTQHMEATDHLLNVACGRGTQFTKGCNRFDAYAMMRALKYMQNVPEEDLSFRNDIRCRALRNCWSVFFDQHATMRDRAGLFSLWLGLRPYFLFWSVYGKLRLIGKKRGQVGQGALI